MDPLTIVEEHKLKTILSQPADPAWFFDWGMLLGDLEPIDAMVRYNGTVQSQFFPRAMAATLGEALTLLLRVRGHQPADLLVQEHQETVVSLTLLIKGMVAQEAPTPGDSDEPLDLVDVATRACSRNDFGALGQILTVLMHSDSEESQLRVRVIRRNDQVVSWNLNKVENAIRKAFLSQNEDPAPASRVALSVQEMVQQTGKQLIHIEEVSDLVERALMLGCHFTVARAFILYRASRTARRKQEDAELAPDVGRDLPITLADGKPGLLTWSSLNARIQFASMNLDLCLDGPTIESELRRSLTPGLTAEQVKATIILNAKSLMQRDADFDKFAGRIMLTYIYEEVLGWNVEKHGIGKLAEMHRKAFRAYLQRGVKIDRLAPELLEMDIKAIAAKLDPLADLAFDYMGISTLYERYCIIDKTVKPHRRLETPQFFWMRVAMGLYTDQTHHTESILEVYDLYRQRLFCSSSPTLFNSGTLRPQLSSCYLYKVDDSIESIFQRGISENAYLSKWAGGLGGSWTNVRGTGSYIKGTNGESQGLIPFLAIHNAALGSINLSLP